MSRLSVECKVEGWDNDPDPNTILIKVEDEPNDNKQVIVWIGAKRWNFFGKDLICAIQNAMNVPPLFGE